MTQTEKEAEVGRVVLELKRLEREIPYPVQTLQGIARQLRTAADALDAVYRDHGDYSRYNTAGSSTIESLPVMADIVKMENEVRDLGRQLARLRADSSRLGLQ